jgi:3-hydroxyisobutyrate dehydrogenase-like beta-hydroxyacid dehydrogenase
MTSRTVGFIGLGQMGLGMALNLLAVGHDVLGHDSRDEPMQRLRAKGGREATDPAQIGEHADTTIVMVATGAQVFDVVCGPRGLLQTMQTGNILVCSTIALTEFLDVEQRARAKGVAVLDCPVSGGEKGANDGSLTMLCGGDEARLDELRPLLRCVAKEIAHLGPVGAGLVGKQANNLIIGINRIAVAEAFAMAQKANVPLDKLFRALTTCSADSWNLRSMEPQLLRNEYPAMTLHAIKDLTAALDSARSVHQSMPLTSLTRELYQMADAKLGGMQGSTHILKFYLGSD